MGRGWAVRPGGPGAAGPGGGAAGRWGGFGLFGRLARPASPACGAKQRAALISIVARPVQRIGRSSPASLSPGPPWVSIPAAASFHLPEGSGRLFASLPVRLAQSQSCLANSRPRCLPPHRTVCSGWFQPSVWPGHACLRCSRLTPTSAPIRLSTPPAARSGRFSPAFRSARSLLPSARPPIPFPTHPTTTSAAFPHLIDNPSSAIRHVSGGDFVGAL